GDYGLVGVLLYELTADTLSVDTFLLSCRVLGRRDEHWMLGFLAKVSRAHQAHWIDLHFVPSAKNKPALDFLEQIGAAFQQPQNGGSVFRLPLEVAEQAAVSSAGQAVSPAASDHSETD